MEKCKIQRRMSRTFCYAQDRHCFQSWTHSSLRVRPASASFQRIYWILWWKSRSDFLKISNVTPQILCDHTYIPSHEFKGTIRGLPAQFFLRIFSVHLKSYVRLAGDHTPPPSRPLRNVFMVPNVRMLHESTDLLQLLSSNPLGQSNFPSHLKKIQINVQNSTKVQVRSKFVVISLKFTVKRSIVFTITENPWEKTGKSQFSVVHETKIWFYIKNYHNFWCRQVFASSWHECSRRNMGQWLADELAANSVALQRPVQKAIFSSYSCNSQSLLISKNSLDWFIV